MNRKPKANSPKRPIRRYKITPCKHRDFREISLNDPNLRWVDSVLRSFQEETPPEWMPAQYQQTLDHTWRPRRLI